ncbi:RIBOc superfamily protein [Streptococcus pneumoniae]|nr:RIBOc superfamily protein [Streptococcus pneumoniae]SNP37310.1 RIBOc superfamily protein [Streptococcus pneumoniae]SNP50180.1 RIBOc superfamily protein [Streptococcus pneumoniae]
MIDVNLINGIALAFEGDAVYSMYIRRHLILKGMTKPNKLHQEARANRDFATADQIRDQLVTQGIKLLDTKDGVRWTRD